MFYRRQHAYDHNFEQLVLKNEAVAEIEAKHDDKHGKSVSVDQCKGLMPTVLLTIGSRVFCTQNFWPEIGIHNGALGYVRDIV